MLSRACIRSNFNIESVSTLHLTVNINNYYWTEYVNFAPVKWKAVIDVKVSIGPVCPLKAKENDNYLKKILID